MRLTKIDEKSFRCEITAGELNGFGVTVEDLVCEKESAHKLVHEVLQEADRQLGIRFPFPAITIRVEQNDNGDLALEVGSADEALIGGVIERMKSKFIEELFRQVSGDNSEEIEDAAPAERSEEIARECEVSLSDPAPTDEAIAVAEAARSLARQAERISFDAAGGFWAELDSVSQGVRLAKHMPDAPKVLSRLYFSRGIYYLFLDFGSFAEIAGCMASVMEYATVVYPEEEMSPAFEERAECLIEEGAIEVLRKLG